MDRETDGILKAFLKERIGVFIAFSGAAGIVALILYLYDIPGEAMQYGFLLAFVWCMIFAVLDFLRYSHRHRILVDNFSKILSDVEKLPADTGLIAQDYQRMIREIYRQKAEMESGERISKQEMSDYYVMWVHQIKNPIAALKVLIQTCEEEEGKSATEDEARGRRTEYLKEMKQELFRIEQYADMVLTYLRMEDMASDLSFEKYSLDKIVRQAVRKNSQMFILRKIGLDYQPLNHMVLTDEKWMVFVVEQILTNALKYTKEGTVSIYMEGKNLVIGDTGIGIWPEDLPRVFERGFTGYNGRADKKSTGIGLYLCKKIMDRLRQEIWIKSEVGVGTKVYLCMERDEVDTRD